MLIWQNGCFFKETSAAGVAAAAVTGPGVFETMLCRQGRVAFLERHLRRLRRSCPVVGITAPPVGYLKRAVAEFIAKNKLRCARLRLSLSKTAGGACVTLSARPQPRQRRSYALMLETKKKLFASRQTRIKSLRRDFYEDLYARSRSRGFDEVVFTNAHNEVMEATRTNIFCVKNGLVMTPRLQSGCLPGVTRAVVLTSLKKEKISCREVRLSVAQLLGSEEIFLTNAIIGVMPVSRIGAQRLSAGSLTRRVARFYRDEVVKACRMR